MKDHAIGVFEPAGLDLVEAIRQALGVGLHPIDARGQGLGALGAEDPHARHEAISFEILEILAAEFVVGPAARRRRRRGSFQDRRVRFVIAHGFSGRAHAEVFCTTC